MNAVQASRERTYLLAKVARIDRDVERLERQKKQLEVAIVKEESLRSEIWKELEGE